ncbi:MAG: hypothetical protein C0463_01525 [Idiomarina sp.]|nr:hypothetical protein [Idiomarina sp.]
METTQQPRSHIMYLPKRILGVSLSAAAIGVLAACSSPEPAQTVTYHCGAQAIQVTPDGDNMRLSYAGTTHQLRPIQAASGARYVNDDEELQISFWSRGYEAQFEVNGQSFPACRQAGAVIEPFSAQGNEPFWSLRIEDGSMIYHRMGEDERSFSIEEQTLESSKSRVKSENGDLVLELDEQLCQDSMSGMFYPQQAQLTLQDGETLQGCAGDTWSLLQGVEWQVTGLDDSDYTDYDVTLRFTHDEERMQVVGRAACNRYFGGYDVTGERLEVGQLAGTKMACEGDAMRVEYEFLNALSKVHGLQPERNEDGVLQLELHTSEGVLRLQQ